MSSQIITGLWSSNFLGNYSVTKIASENTPVQMPLPSLQANDTYWYSVKKHSNPLPQRTVDSTVHVFLS